MRVAAVVVGESCGATGTAACWMDPGAGRILQHVELPYSPNLEILPGHGFAVVTYTDFAGDDMRCTIDIYGLEDWNKVASLPTDCRATFNVRQMWRTIQPGPHENSVYMFQIAALGDHLGEEAVCGLDLRNYRLSGWEFKFPQNVIGWTGPAGQAHAQFLFSPEGYFAGELPTDDLEQSVCFWLGPEEGLGPIIPIGPRPLLHSDLGHARAICGSAQRTVVVRNDGRVHVLDPISFRHVEIQQLQLPPGHAPVNHAVAIDPSGQTLYVGVATHDLRCSGVSEYILVHNLERKGSVQTWKLEPRLQHFSLTEHGRYLFGAAFDVPQVRMFDALSGKIEAVISTEGSVHYLVATSEL